MSSRKSTFALSNLSLSQFSSPPSPPVLLPPLPSSKTRAGGNSCNDTNFSTTSSAGSIPVRNGYANLRTSHKIRFVDTVIDDRLNQLSVKRRTSQRAKAVNTSLPSSSNNHNASSANLNGSIGSSSSNSSGIGDSASVTATAASTATSSGGRFIPRKANKTASLEPFSTIHTPKDLFSTHLYVSPTSSTDVLRDESIRRKMQDILVNYKRMNPSAVLPDEHTLTNDTFDDEDDDNEFYAPGNFKPSNKEDDLQMIDSVLKHYRFIASSSTPPLSSSSASSSLSSPTTTEVAVAGGQGVPSLDTYDAGGNFEFGVSAPIVQRVGDGKRIGTSAQRPHRWQEPSAAVAADPAPHTFPPSSFQLPVEACVRVPSLVDICLLTVGEHFHTEVVQYQIRTSHVLMLDHVLQKAMTRVLQRGRLLDQHISLLLYACMYSQRSLPSYSSSVSIEGDESAAPHNDGSPAPLLETVFKFGKVTDLTIGVSWGSALTYDATAHMNPAGTQEKETVVVHNQSTDKKSNTATENSSTSRLGLHMCLRDQHQLSVKGWTFLALALQGQPLEQAQSSAFKTISHVGAGNLSLELGTYASAIKSTAGAASGSLSLFSPTSPPAVSHFIVPTLTALDVSLCPSLNDEMLSLLALSCPHLVKIDISGCPLVGNKGVAELGRRCTKLKEVKMEMVEKLGDMGLQDLLHAVPHLISLQLAGCRRLTNVSFQIIGSRCRNLRVFSAAGCPQFRDIDLVDIGGLKSLSFLSCRACKRISDKGILAMLGKRREKACKALKAHSSRRSKINTHSQSQDPSYTGEVGFVFLDLGGCSSLTDVAFIAVTKSPTCAFLTHLDVRGWTQLTRNAIHHLASSSVLAHLAWLNVCGCTGVEDETWDWFRKQKPTIKLIGVQSD